MSGLKLIFHWSAHVAMVSRSRNNCMCGSIIWFLLTQRKIENFTNNIKDELNKIEIIYDNLIRNDNGIFMKNLINIKHYFMEKAYKIIKKVLLFFFVEEKLKKIARILYNMTKF